MEGRRGKERKHTKNYINESPHYSLLHPIQPKPYHPSLLLIGFETVQREGKEGRGERGGGTERGLTWSMAG